jgi:Uma2 family endonuclease
MTLEEFLRWDDGTDTRYELIDGYPVAMAPPAEGHRILAVRLVSRIDAALEAGGRAMPNRARSGPPRPFRFVLCPRYCRHLRAQRARRGQAMVDPILIVEILSPSTERTDRRSKLPAYQTIESVREIMFIDADSHHAELYGRENDYWGIQLVRGAVATLFLGSVDLRISMSELYEGIAIPATTAGS